MHMICIINLTKTVKMEKKNRLGNKLAIKKIAP